MFSDKRDFQFRCKNSNFLKYVNLHSDLATFRFYAPFFPAFLFQSARIIAAKRVSRTVWRRDKGIPLGWGPCLRGRGPRGRLGAGARRRGVPPRRSILYLYIGASIASSAPTTAGDRDRYWVWDQRGRKVTTSHVSRFHTLGRPGRAPATRLIERSLAPVDCHVPVIYIYFM